MAEKVSKNAREGRRAADATRCPAGHEPANVSVVGSGMQRLCACVGYVPIDASKPYLQIKAPEAQGKAGLPRKSRGCQPCKA